MIFMEKRRRYFLLKEMMMKAGINLQVIFQLDGYIRMKI